MGETFFPAEELLRWLNKGGGERGGREGAVPFQRGLNLSCHGQISTKEANDPGSFPAATTSRHPGRTTGRVS